MKGLPLNILLVEDNLDHMEMIRRSFEDHRVANRFFHVEDGELALNFLFRRPPYSNASDAPTPNLILLDLRLPKIDGLEVLKAVKTDSELRKIPVVVLTTSEAENDIARAYEFHANSYMVKPIDFKKFSNLMNELGLYWLAWNRNPY